MLAAMTGRETLQARPKAALDSTKTYGTFCWIRLIVSTKVSPELEEMCTFSSQSRGRCKRISRGSVSAVRTMSSAIPRFKVFVARKQAWVNVSGGGDITSEEKDKLYPR